MATAKKKTSNKKIAAAKRGGGAKKGSTKKPSAASMKQLALNAEKNGAWVSAADFWVQAAQATSTRKDEETFKANAERCREEAENAEGAAAEARAADAGEGQEGGVAGDGATTAPAAASAAKPKRARKEKAAKPDAIFQHDDRVLPYVGKTLQHTNRLGEVFEVEVLEDGFVMGRKRYKTLSGAAKDAAGGKSVNGFLHFGIIKPERKISEADRLEAMKKSFGRFLDHARAAVAFEDAALKKEAKDILKTGAQQIDDLWA